jgi:hypothetical protein
VTRRRFRGKNLEEAIEELKAWKVMSACNGIGQEPAVEKRNLKPDALHLPDSARLQN